MSKNIVQGLGHVFYPESCPIENVKIFILDRYNCCVSPLHDRDLNSKGGFKKPHYHILFVGKLTESDKRYISKITTMQHFESLYDLDASYLYLYHWSKKTNWYIENKAQYWSADILKGENFDFSLSDSSSQSSDFNYDLYHLCTISFGFTDLYNRLFTDKTYSEEFVSFCLSRHSFVNNYYRNLSFEKSNIIGYDLKKSNKIANLDNYRTDFERISYAKRVDSNPFLDGFENV